MLANITEWKKCITFANRNQLSDGVIGNTSDFGSEDSRFETWSDNFPLTQSHFMLNICHVNSNCQRVFPVIRVVNFFMKIANGLIEKSIILQFNILII